jgi:hypothetical protein
MCEAKIDQKSHGANWKETVLEAPEGGGDGEDPFNTDLVGRGDEGGEGEDFWGVVVVDVVALLLALLNEDVDFEMDLNKPGDDVGLLVFRCGVSCKAKLLGGTSLVNTHFSLSSSCVYLFINNLPALVRKEARSLAFIRGLFEIGGFKEEVLLLLSKFNDKGDALN